jgi:hypothetical protein
MTVSAVTFRESYPEFDATAYPTSAVNYFLAVATILLSTARFGVGATAAASPPTTEYDLVTELFVAHFLTLEKRAQDAASAGGVPGEVQGPVASKSVGPLSVSYANSAVIQLDAGHWNNSMYGIRFIQLARYFGAGPIQIGIGRNLSPFGLGAWPGPFATGDWLGWN